MGQSTNTCWMFLTYLVQGQLAMSLSDFIIWPVSVYIAHLLILALCVKIMTWVSTTTSHFSAYMAVDNLRCIQFENFSWSKNVPPLFPAASLVSVTLLVFPHTWLSALPMRFASPLHVSNTVPNIAVLKVIPCGGWRTKEEAPSHSPNEIFPRFWWSASGAAIALEACPHWALALDQGELSSAT